MTQGINMKLIPALVLMAFAGTAGASGFAIQNQTGSGNGNAFAGAAAAAEDAGTIFFNPAGMTYLPMGHSVSASGTLLNRSINYSDKGSTDSAGFRFLTNNTNGGNAGGLSLLPAGYWSYSISQALRIGVGVSPTFGNTTEYDQNFIGRSAGYYAHIEQININPSIAYKLNEKVSLGAGINFAKNKTHFRQGLPANAGGLVNFLDVEGDAWAVGYNLGAMFQLSPSTRVGVTYRSALTFDLEGKQFSSVSNLASAALTNQDIKAQLKTPGSASLAVSQKLSDRWEMLGDFTWTNWSVINSIQIKNRGGSGADLSALSYNFKDSWRVGLGANYQYNNDWKLRFGLAYDKTPVRGDTDRTMTLPDSDRTWLSFGAKYQISPAASVDLGYSHIFFKSTTTARNVDLPAGSTRQVINGSWNNSADLLSVQYNHTF